MTHRIATGNCWTGSLGYSSAVGTCHLVLGSPEVDLVPDTLDLFEEQTVLGVYSCLIRRLGHISAVQEVSQGPPMSGQQAAGAAGGGGGGCHT